MYGNIAYPVTAIFSMICCANLYTEPNNYRNESWQYLSWQFVKFVYKPNFIQ